MRLSDVSLNQRDKKSVLKDSIVKTSQNFHCDIVKGLSYFVCDMSVVSKPLVDFIKGSCCN